MRVADFDSTAQGFTPWWTRCDSISFDTQLARYKRALKITLGVGKSNDEARCTSIITSCCSGIRVARISYGDDWLIFVGGMMEDYSGIFYVLALLVVVALWVIFHPKGQK